MLRRAWHRLRSRGAGRLLALAVGVALLLALAGLAVSAGPLRQRPTPLTAVTTLSLFADFARQVGGERVEVVALLGDGVDVHGYQPTPGDLVALSRAQLLLYNGFDLEPFLGQLLAGAGRPELVRVALAEGLPPLVTAGRPNPHFWLNPQFAVHYVERIRDAFAAADPAGAASYHQNAARYIAELQALDAELEQQLSVIPAERRQLVVAHDAFPYFAQRYGFRLIGAVLSSEAQEPTPGELLALLQQLRQAGARALFVEPQFTSRLVEQLARETGVRVLPLYSDAFPPDGSIRSYVDLMRANARNIVEGLR
ncbi:MAG TPA: metal ABC transporter substrate-binding protein [Chloroflexota bacterium]|jgi:ABC-type Zn uptake system ZnuABC Zn-binding protein ZnuA|nr:metal ABC transporter substrate-binding protein [Chloroflexota bacterium]